MREKQMEEISLFIREKDFSTKKQFILLLNAFVIKLQKQSIAKFLKKNTI